MPKEREIDRISRKSRAGFLRPEALVLAEGAVVPEKNILAPAPNQFSHRLAQDEPFYFHGADQQDSPSGMLAKDTRVMLLCYDGGKHCWIADEHGLYVQVSYGSLKKL